MLRGMYHGIPMMKQSPSKEFYKCYAENMGNALDQGFLYVKVAHDYSDDNLIIGYIVTTARTGAVVWCYTKAAFRKQGVLNKLTEGLIPPHCLLLTEIGNVIRIKKQLDYKPWRV